MGDSILARGFDTGFLGKGLSGSGWVVIIET